MTSRSSLGFTLLEVLVALAVVAIALLAAMRAAGNVSDNAQRYRLTVLAEQCAQNYLVDQRLSKSFLAIGQNTSACTQANVPFTVAVDVMPTPNPNFRRVQVNVLDASGWSAWQVITIIGNL
ncbi:MAG: type II secretion system protein GspI [Thiomonas sp. 20-64-5]|nr:MAG: type II secretion system protein GspI [Thiomonas sp. 20-64-5]